MITGTMRFGILAVVMMLFAGCAGTKYTIGDGYDAAQKAFEERNYTAAIENYQKYLNTNPEGGMAEIALYYLGESYKMIGNEEKAIESYEKLVNTYKTGSWVNWAKNDLKELGAM